MGGWLATTTNPICPHAVNPDGARNVLQLLLAHVLEGKIELTRSVSPHPSRNTDPAGFGQGFEPRRDVHSIPEDVVVLDDHVALMKADTELDAFVRRRGRIPLGHARLHLGRAPQGIDHTAELDQQAIARCLDEPAVVRGDRRINQLGADSLQRLEGAAFVRADQS